jgi:hypothetical protein
MGLRWGVQGVDRASKTWGRAPVGSVRLAVPRRHTIRISTGWRVSKFGHFNLLWEYSIEYGNTQLSGPIREAGVAELSGPASAPSLSGSGTTRGHRSLGRQCPSAPPAALQSDNFRPPPEMLEMWRQKRRQRKIEQPPGKSGKVGRCLALLGSEWDVQKGPDPPKLGMPECRSTHLSMKPDRIEASCRGDRRAATWGLRRACRPGGVGLQRREMAARAVGELRVQFTYFILK